MTSVYDSYWYQRERNRAQAQNDVHIAEHEGEERGKRYLDIFQKQAELRADEEEFDRSPLGIRARKAWEEMVRKGEIDDDGNIITPDTGDEDFRDVSLHKKESNVDKTELEAKLADNLKALGKNAVAIAKSIVEKDSNLGLTEAEFVEIIRNHDRKPGETEAKCFARHFEANTEDGLALRKAVAVLKALPPVLDFQPVSVGGVAAYHEALSDRSKAYDQLVDMARKMRERVPQMTEAQAFERTLMDPENRRLAEQALNPPPATTSYPFPKWESSPPRP